MFRKFEISNSGRQEGAKRIEEVLAFLPSGKIYVDQQGNPKEAKIQESQKGSVCWYYALARLRKHYGKEWEDGNRYVEEAISKYRKDLTNAELFHAIAKIILENPPFGLKKDQANIMDFLNIVKRNEHVNNRQDLDRFKEDLELFLQAQSLYLAHYMNQDDDNIKNLSDDLSKLLLKDIPLTADAQKNVLSTSSSFLDLIYRFSSIANEDVLKNSPNLQVLKRRLSVLILVILINYGHNGEREQLKKLNLEELIRYSALSLKIYSVKALFNKLNIKATPEFFEKIFTDGVYNSVGLKLLKKEAKKFSKWINGSAEGILAEALEDKDFDKLDAFYAQCQNLAYAHIVKRYGLQVSKWAPLDGFDKLMEIINQDGALLLIGNIGKHIYKVAPEQLMDQDKPVKVGSRSIKFWKDSDVTPIDPATRELHAIVAIGAQKVQEGANLEEYVYFLDPNDSSAPNEERTMYRMKWTDLKERIYTQNVVRITDSNCEIKDPYYAVSSINR